MAEVIEALLKGGHKITHDKGTVYVDGEPLTEDKGNFYVGSKDVVEDEGFFIIGGNPAFGRSRS